MTRRDDDRRPFGDDRSMRDFRRIADKEAMQTKALAEATAATAKRLRMRRFTWCRAENAVYDDKKWRRVARMAGAPLHLVEAFVLRLDLHASAATPRGSLDPFVVEDLAAHWGLANEDVLGRIYAALEHPDIGWIDQDHLVTFWPRNPDTEDTTAADRQDRSKAFKRAMKTIADYARSGQIDSVRRLQMEKELFALRDEGRRGHFPRGELHRRLNALTQLSTAETAHDVTAVTTVSITPRADQTFSKSGETVDNRTAVASGESAELSKGQVPWAAIDPQAAQAELWLDRQGKQLVTERMNATPSRAATLIERWLRRVGGSHRDLAEIITSAAARGLGGRLLNAAQFDLTIGESCDRRRSLIEDGAQLAMGPAGTTTIRESAPAEPESPPAELPERKAS